MRELTLQGELGHKLSIIVRGYEQESARDPHDANWLQCTAEAVQGSFYGTIHASFITTDFSRLLHGLDGVLNDTSTTASFDTMEENLSFFIEVDRTGKFHVSGELRELGAFGPVLSFSFASDRALLSKAYADLKRIVEKFPERTVFQ